MKLQTPSPQLTPYSSFFLTLLTFFTFSIFFMNTASAATHTFSIGDQDFLLDNQHFQIRCGEIHFARVPKEYWRQRLQLCKAMGLNTVCAYLFWNFHEWEKGKYDWSGQADAAEFCKEAQEEGLWVILRPGPYACAEWEMGGLPWWLLKNDNIKLRTRDPEFMAASGAWLKEVGRVLGPQQVTKGGPILMVQVENEYGFYGSDAEYVRELRQATLDAGFDVPLFQCNPPGTLKKGLVKELFQVVNFGKDPESGFKALREVQPTGPLMCGEFYPGWFDTWGFPHHRGETDRYLKDLEYMLSHNASFSIYMAHGGTSFGMWGGADRPFKPDTSSYDYDAPISEAAWIGEKFQLTREVMAKHLLPGETLPEPAAQNPVITIPRFSLGESAAVLDNLPAPVEDETPRSFEAYDQGRGCILYRTTLPAGPAGKLTAKSAHDFAWVLVDGKQAGIMDRRNQRFTIELPAREKPAQLDILVEAMGRVNFGQEMHDRKGLYAPVSVIGTDGKNEELHKWQVFRLPLDAPMLAGLKWKSQKSDGAAFWHGTFNVEKPQDTFLDLSKWGKGVVWVNGRCLARYWNIGPTQTAYLPGPWLKAGANDIVILDLVGPSEPNVAGLDKPVLDQLHPELDFSRGHGPSGKLLLENVKPTYSGTFADGPKAQDVHFAQPVEGRQFCLETLNAFDGKPFAAVAELDVLDADGNSLPHTQWTIAYVDSEEIVKEDGSALNAINGQTADYWHSEWNSATPPGHPHHLVIDLGAAAHIGGFRYTPRPGAGSGRIKDYRIYVGDKLVQRTQ